MYGFRSCNWMLIMTQRVSFNATRSHKSCSLLSLSISDHAKEKKEALGEVLNGDRLISAPYEFKFKDDKDSISVCNKKLTKEDVKKFRSAFEKDYYFQMYYDDLPIWGFIGKVDKEGKSDPSDFKYYLYKHIVFEILYNKNRVVEINAQMDPHSVVDVTEVVLMWIFIFIHSNADLETSSSLLSFMELPM